jgi:hypothetical protein
VKRARRGFSSDPIVVAIALVQSRSSGFGLGLEQEATKETKEEAENNFAIWRCSGGRV